MKNIDSKIKTTEVIQDTDDSKNTGQGENSSKW